jgi:hypothetical protein
MSLSMASCLMESLRIAAFLIAIVTVGCGDENLSFPGKAPAAVANIRFDPAS